MISELFFSRSNLKLEVTHNTCYKSNYKDCPVSNHDDAKDKNKARSKKKVKFENFVVRSKKAGPIYGAGLGILPQCAFSAVMSDLYSKRMITLGTLFAVFIATSDEAIPILLYRPDKYLSLLVIIGIKFVFAIIVGYVIDLIFRKQERVSEEELVKQIVEELKNNYLKSDGQVYLLFDNFFHIHHKSIHQFYKQVF